MAESVKRAATRSAPLVPRTGRRYHSEPPRTARPGAKKPDLLARSGFSFIRGGSMKRSTRLRRARWTEKARTGTKHLPIDHVRPVPNDEPVSPPALGPYESAYDVTLGYAHERSIVVP